MADDILIVRGVFKAKSVADIKLAPNQVLVRTITDNMNATTASGLVRVSKQFEKNQFLASYVNRVHEVIKVCPWLSFFTPTNKTADNCLRWKCSIEIEVGDIVWSSYLCMLEYDCFVIDDVEYKLINYRELRMAKKPSGEYVMLNGWIMFDHPKISRSSIIVDPNPTVEYDKGIVLRLGKPNTAYIVKEKTWCDLDGGREALKVGDTFLKSNHGHRLGLEDLLFPYYEQCPVYVIQRKDVVAIM